MHAFDYYSFVYSESNYSYSNKLETMYLHFNDNSFIEIDSEQIIFERHCFDNDNDTTDAYKFYDKHLKIGQIFSYKLTFQNEDRAEKWTNENTGRFYFANLFSNMRRNKNVVEFDAPIQIFHTECTCPRCSK